MATKYKRRLGDRKDGRRIRSLDPYNMITPYIMKDRNDASNQFSDKIEVTELDRYIRRKRTQGMKSMGILHVLIASYVRTVSQCPGINRFISGQRIFSRNNIEVVMTVKKEMLSTGSETSIKVVFDPADTIDDVYNKINAEIEKVKTGAVDTSTDNVAGALMKLPRIVLRFAVSVITFFDYFGLLPQWLINASPFHGSMIITDLGSLGIPPIYHHIYNFGNLPVFFAFGAKRRCYEVDKDGKPVERKYVDYTVVSDERICDGFYYSVAFRHIKSYLRHPELLDVPPEKIVEDIK